MVKEKAACFVEVAVVVEVDVLDNVLKIPCKIKKY